MLRLFFYSSFPILSLLAFAACGSDGTGAGGNAGGPGGLGGQGTTSSSSSSTSSSSTTTTTVTDCDDLSSNGCFSNLDCSKATDHCDVVGMSGEDPVACCVPGERGKGKGGDPCTAPNDCETAVCLVPHNVCSASCTNGVQCPASQPTCVPLMGFEGAFCTPD